MCLINVEVQLTRWTVRQSRDELRKYIISVSNYPTVRAIESISLSIVSNNISYNLLRVNSPYISYNVLRVNSPYISYNVLRVNSPYICYNVLRVSGMLWYTRI